MRTLGALVTFGVVLLGACGSETFGSERVLAVDGGGFDASAAPDAPPQEEEDGGGDRDAAPQTIPTPCGPARAGPEMVLVPGDDAGVPSFCIDATEVTQGDYVNFLAAVGTAAKVPDLPTQCAPKTRSHLPGGAKDCQFNAFQPDLAPRMPVGCVDWCDAYAFCRWADKHLCGAVGGGGSPEGERNVSAKNEWFRACSGAADNGYPYGATFDANACNTGNKGTLLTAPAKATCEGGVTGLFDMSGNVAEWTDSCALSGPDIRCANRGGDFGDGEMLDLACSADVADSALARRFQLGFRCCK